MSTYLHCTGCARTFSSERAFVTHRTGSYARGRQKSQRRCLSVDELRGAGLVEHAKTAGARAVWTPAARIESWHARQEAILSAPDIKSGHSEAPAPAATAQAQAVA